MSSCFLTWWLPSVLDNPSTEEILPLSNLNLLWHSLRLFPLVLSFNPQKTWLWLLLRTQPLPTLRPCIDSDFGIQLKGMLNFGKQQEVCYKVTAGCCFWYVSWPVNHTAFYALATWILTTVYQYGQLRSKFPNAAAWTKALREDRLFQHFPIC